MNSSPRPKAGTFHLPTQARQIPPIKHRPCRRQVRHDANHRDQSPDRILKPQQPNRPQERRRNEHVLQQPPSPHHPPRRFHPHVPPNPPPPRRRRRPVHQAGARQPPRIPIRHPPRDRRFPPLPRVRRRPRQVIPRP